MGVHGLVLAFEEVGVHPLLMGDLQVLFDVGKFRLARTDSLFLVISEPVFVSCHTLLRRLVHLRV